MYFTFSENLGGFFKEILMMLVSFDAGVFCTFKVDVFKINSLK